MQETIESLNSDPQENHSSLNVVSEVQQFQPISMEELSNEYLNSNMINCNQDEKLSDMFEESYYGMVNKTEQEEYSEEENRIISIKYSVKSYDNMSEEYSDYSQKGKRQPLKVLRKTGISNIHRHIDIELNFMLLGDIFIHKDVFIDCRDRKLSNICPVSAYRPVISTEKNDKFCLAFVDNTSNGISDIRIPAQLLSQLNFDKAYEVSQGLQQLMTFYANVQTLQQKVNTYYSNDRSKVENLIYSNHQQSLVIAQQYLKRLTQDKIIMFHYKKIDPATLTHKLVYTGSNMTMSELFTGRSDFQVMEQYMNRIGTPRYIDAEGMVNLTLAKFQGQTNFNLNLITLDDLIIPLNCSIKRIFLNEFEIIPGEKMSEYLDIHILDANLNVIQDVLAKRKQPSQLQNVSQLEYEMKAEIFLQKFYQEENRNIQQNIYA